MNTLFHGYMPMAGAITARARGSLVAYEPGTAVTYGLRAAELRGILFIGAGTEVYAGMVVGEQAREGDLDVNVCKGKKLTSMRENSKGEIEQRLSPPRIMSLDEAIEQLAEDELLEVTPKSLRIRKKILDMHTRGREAKRAKMALEE
jgi:GTP-binding protein